MYAYIIDNMSMTSTLLISIYLSFYIEIYFNAGDWKTEKASNL